MGNGDFVIVAAGSQVAYLPTGSAPSPPSRLMTDTDHAEFIRRKAETIYHPVGSCRMGKDDRAVVDSELRVRGVEGLRVVDASISRVSPPATPTRRRS
jgi:choline dehydrogenase-like flavoprotein